MNRRTFISAVAGSATATGLAGYLLGGKVQKESSEEPNEENKVSWGAPDDGYDTAMDTNAMKLEDWTITGGVELLFTEKIGVTTVDEPIDKLSRSDFEFIESKEDHHFALNYAAGHKPDGERPSPPPEMWGLDVWMANTRYSPRLTKHSDTKWYYLPENIVESDNPLEYINPAYGENIMGGGWLCYEVKKENGTHMQHFGADRDDFNLKLESVDAYWQWYVEEAGENDEIQ